MLQNCKTVIYHIKVFLVNTFLLSDILWSDPCENDNDALNVNWCENENRGCSFVFGSRATNFLNENDLLSIIRAHEAQLDGFKMCIDGIQL